MKNQTRKLVFAALLAALTCVATMVIRIPSPLHGYINLGDCFVLVSGWVLGPVYGLLAAGIGSALADVFAGYFNYALATFVIKGLMAVAAYFVLKALGKVKSKTVGYIVSGIAAELIMILGYFVFEGFMYGFAAVLVNIPPNAVQGVAGIVVGTAIKAVVDKTKLKF